LPSGKGKGVAVRAVIDTNIWISAFLSPFGAAAKLRKAFADRSFEPVLSLPMFEELGEVLSRPKILEKYRLSADDIREFLSLLNERSESVNLDAKLSLCRDPDDDAIIETAIISTVQYLVTGDNDIKSDRTITSYLMARGVAVVTVPEFLALLAVC